MIQNLINSIVAGCGINISGYAGVQGGDINECYCLSGDGTRYFLKLNDADSFPGMFTMEADGLEALRNSCKLTVPQVIKQGVIKDRQWLLLQWVEKGTSTKDLMQHFGAALAGLHHKPQAYFGWHRDNYIGSLPQVNMQLDGWPDFYMQCRIMPLVKTLFDAGSFSAADAGFAESLCKKFGGLFPKEPPALLHGDLWNGNYMITASEDVAIFDPAVYYGHREMDLGMTKLFGGFSQAFYDAYHSRYPLEKGWHQRLPLTQLYPILVHAVLFGGHYIGRARDIILKFAG